MEKVNSPEMAEVEKKSQQSSYYISVVSFLNRHIKAELILLFIFAAVLWAPTIYANLSTRSQRYDITRTPINNLPKRRVAIVFGAGVLPNGKPTPYLQWRVETAVELYKANKVEKILMSGDNSSKRYNEPVAMGKFAQNLGVPASDIVLDYAGYSTYDSCYRAREIFKISDATLISQGYHLPRAVMTCKALGINSIGVVAKHTSRDFTVSYIVREWSSTDKAIIQMAFKPKATVLGPTEPIFE